MSPSGPKNRLHDTDDSTHRNTTSHERNFIVCRLWEFSTSLSDSARDSCYRPIGGQRQISARQTSSAPAGAARGLLTSASAVIERFFLHGGGVCSVPPSTSLSI